MSLAAVFVLGLVFSQSARGRTLEVGSDHELKAPSEAAAMAVAGDTIEIEPGEYFDCAIWTADRLIIVGKGSGAVITDKTCQGKALFITVGSDITIRNLTFTRARVPDGNGAGIRAEGRDLTIEHSRFVNNENGVLAGDSPQSTVRIADSEFTQNGRCGERGCAHGVYVDHVALLRIERSKFTETMMGHHIKSRALRTELVDNQITDGRTGTSSYLVDIPSGGSIVMERNILEKGPSTSNPKAAVMIGGEGITQPIVEFKISTNRFVNDNVTKTVFILNWSDATPLLEGNSMQGDVTEISSAGFWVHRIRVALREIWDDARRAPGWVKRTLHSAW